MEWGKKKPCRNAAGLKSCVGAFSLQRLTGLILL